jgi:outer membrane protein TolC
MALTATPPARCQLPDTLSLESAITLAQQENLSVKLSQLELKQSERRVQELGASRYPSLQLRSHYLHAPETGYNEIVTNGGEYGLQLSASLPLYDGGQRGTLLDQAANNRERASLAVAKQGSETAYMVKLQYYDILRAEAEVGIRTETVDRLDEYIALLKQLRLGGLAAESDLLKAQVDAGNAGVQLEQARQGLRKAKLLLSSMIGVPMTASFSVLPVGESDSLAVPHFFADENPAVKLLEHDKRSATYDVSLAAAERFPLLSVAVDAGALGVTPSELHQDLGYSVLLSIEVPLFSWGAIDARIEQKELVREQAEAQLQLTRRSAETEWMIASDDLELARRNLVSLSKNVRDAEENYLSAKSRFVGGSGSSLEVLDAQRLIVESKLNYSATLYQLRTDLATLIKLIGQR